MSRDLRECKNEQDPSKYCAGRSLFGLKFPSVKVIQILQYKSTSLSLSSVEVM
jgi:hypothetical protein